MTVLRSRDNTRLRRWRSLIRDSRIRRAEGRAWIEGPHLLAEYLARVASPVVVIVDETRRHDPELSRLIASAHCETVVLSSTLFGKLADTQSPSGIAAEIVLPVALRAPRPESDQSIFLDRVQDPGNLGTILRSAASFSAREVVLGPGCADPWSPRVLRAGMGGHFALPVREARDLASELSAFRGTRICTVVSGGVPLPQLALAGPTAWIFGSEGGGVSDEIGRLADQKATIPLHPGSESINVAVAASICLYEARRRRLPGRSAQKA